MGLRFTGLRLTTIEIAELNLQTYQVLKPLPET